MGRDSRIGPPASYRFYFLDESGPLGLEYGLEKDFVSSGRGVKSEAYCVIGAVSHPSQERVVTKLLATPSSKWQDARVGAIWGSSKARGERRAHCFQ